MASPKTKKPEYKQKRSWNGKPLIAGIEANLTREWMSASDLLKKVYRYISKERAEKQYRERVHCYDRDDAATQLRKGRAVQLQLTCISLVKQGRIEQRGVGREKEYRLASKQKAASKSNKD